LIYFRRKKISTKHTSVAEGCATPAGDVAVAGALVAFWAALVVWPLAAAVVAAGGACVVVLKVLQKYLILLCWVII
jgi:hypothetical protein